MRMSGFMIGGVFLLLCGCREETVLPAAGQVVRGEATALHVGVQPATPQVGDTVHVSWHVDVPDGWHVDWPALEVYGYGPVRGLESPSSAERVLAVDVDAPDTLVVPAVRVAMRGESRSEVLESAPIEVAVRSVLEADESMYAPRAIIGPRELSTGASWWDRGVLLAAAALLAWFLFARLRRRRDAHATSQDARGTALAALDRLANGSADDVTATRAMCYRLSAIMRAYAGHCLSVPALEMTSEEVVEQLATRHGALADAVVRFAQLCHAVDAVKYAGRVTGLDGARRMIEAGRDWIRQYDAVTAESD